MDSTTDAASNSLLSADPLPGSAETSSFLDKIVVNDIDSSVSDDGFVSGEEDFDVEKKSFLASPDDKVVEFMNVDVNSGDPFENPISGGEEKGGKDVGFVSLGEGLNGGVEGNGDVVEKSFKDVVGESGEGLNGVVEGNVVQKTFKDVVVEGVEGLSGVVEGNGNVVEKSFKDVLKSGKGLDGVVEGNGNIVEKSFKDVVAESGEGLNGNVVEKSFEDVVVENGEGLNGDVVEKKFKDVVAESGEGINEVAERNGDVVKKSFKDVIVENGEGLNGVVEGNGGDVEKSFKDVVVEDGEEMNGVTEGNSDVVEKSLKDVVAESGEGMNGVAEVNGVVVEKSFKDVVVESGEGFLGDVDGVMEEGFREDKVSELSEGLGSGVEEINLEGEKHVVESSESEQVVDVVVELGNGAEVTQEGDTVVETINVDLLEPGVAVVGEIKGNGTADRSISSNAGSDQVSAGTVVEGSGENIVVPTDAKKLSLDNESDELIVGTHKDSLVHNIIASLKSELSELDGPNLTPDVDSFVEDIHVNSAVSELPVGIEKVGVVVSSNYGVDQVHGETVSAVQDVKTAQPEMEALRTEDVKTTPEEDSVIENIEVDMSEPGVAVVTKIEENGQADACVGYIQENEVKPITQVEGDAEASAKSGSHVEGVEVVSIQNLVGVDVVADAPHSISSFRSNAEQHKRNDDFSASVQDETIENGASEKSSANNSAEPNQLLNKESDLKDGINFGNNGSSEDDIEGSGSEGDSNDMIFGSSEAAKQFIEELERGSEGNSNSGAESSLYNAQRIDGQIVADSEEEDSDEEGEGTELFDSAALTALLKAAKSAGSDGGNITITSPDGSGLFSIERPVGLGSSTQFLRPAPRANRSTFFTPSSFAGGEEFENLSAEEKGKLEKLQSVRVKFLRLVRRLGMSPDDSIVARVLYKLELVAGRQSGQIFNLDSAKQTALQLEEDEKEDLDFSLNILVLGKSGVGKSATINAIFGEEKARVDAFQHGTTTVKEIIGVVDGVKIRVIDTPGLKSLVKEQSFNRCILSSVKKFTKKNPVDIVLYVDRLDAQTRDLNDLPLLCTITSSLGSLIWRSVIVTLTHAASAPPEGQYGSPLTYDSFVSQRSQVVQQLIGKASGELGLLIRSMNPVCLVENHGSCRRNREGHKILPNGQSWRPQLMILCYSTKILSEADSITKPQDTFDARKLFGYRTRPAPLPYMLSSMLQSRVHPKLSSEQGGDNGDSDVDLTDLSDSDQEDEDEYDQLPPFKPLRKSQLAKLSVDQRKAYFEEYDYRVKLLQKKQWREELKRLKEMKIKGKDSANDYGYSEEDPDAGSPAPVSVPLPDMALPPSFDGDNPAHRYRFLEPTSQFMARPVLDTHGWDHDCGYDGVNLEQSLAILSQFPAVVSVQLTKDKKEFTVHLDSSIAAKHGENGSSMAGFDIQNIGRQLAYIIRGETKFKNFRKNKTAAGISVTFLGENVVTGLKVEDQISFGKQYSLVASGGTVRSQQDVAYGANIEMQRRELDYPIGQVQSSLGLSIINLKGDLAMGFNSLVNFSIGRSSKVTVRAQINKQLNGQISVRTSSSEHLSLALASILPVAVTIYKKLYPVGEKYSIY